MTAKLLEPRARSARPVGASKDYLSLVREFPLRPLRSAAELDAAGQILDRLVGREDLSEGQRDYLAALAVFVEQFERERQRRVRARLTPLDLLKHLMAENDMSTADLGRVLGSRGLASEVLSGKRGLSKTLIARLAERFSVDPGLFLASSARQGDPRGGSTSVDRAGR